MSYLSRVTYSVHSFSLGPGAGQLHGITELKVFHDNQNVLMLRSLLWYEKFKNATGYWHRHTTQTYAVVLGVLQYNGTTKPTVLGTLH